MYMQDLGGFWSDLSKKVTGAVPQAIQTLVTGKPKAVAPAEAPTVIVQASKFPVVPVVIGAGALLMVTLMMTRKREYG